MASVERPSGDMQVSVDHYATLSKSEDVARLGAEVGAPTTEKEKASAMAHPPGSITIGSLSRDCLVHIRGASCRFPVLNPEVHLRCSLRTGAVEIHTKSMPGGLAPYRKVNGIGLGKPATQQYSRPKVVRINMLSVAPIDTGTFIGSQHWYRNGERLKQIGILNRGCRLSSQPR